MYIHVLGDSRNICAVSACELIDTGIRCRNGLASFAPLPRELPRREQSRACASENPRQERRHLTRIRIELRPKSMPEQALFALNSNIGSRQKNNRSEEH